MCRLHVSLQSKHNSLNVSSAYYAITISHNFTGNAVIPIVFNNRYAIFDWQEFRSA